MNKTTTKTTREEPPLKQIELGNFIQLEDGIFQTNSRG